MQHIVNAQGLNMPKLGLGTWPMLGDECTRAVEQALELGYRHIDTAAAYNNEDAVGQALANTPTPREQIHVTTKVWWDQLQPDAMRHSMERSLKALRSEYVDLFMIHWPSTDWDLPRTLDTLASFKEQGLARNIGVANFPLPLLRTVVEEYGIPLSAIQVEYHVLLGQNALLDYARQHDLALTAYTPLARNKVSEIPQIQQIAEKHGVLPTQVALKWLLDQNNVAAIPKASSRANQLANLASLQVELDAEDRALIAALPKNQRQVSPDFAPVWDAFDR
ncbi:MULTISPECIES: aldo/keto reductase [Pseudomonas]|uniref:Aldo/keto reductase n=1 Tax=Pseudomonas fluorescens TaxID=294 RepID=A0A854XMM5_PSEFL|nr:MULTISPECIES: aldo/keto reductase [Pseudomonas]PCM50885.1 aldo/keto reductase [Pseudomonas fluorescens]POA27117.1 aldo/keto reductase [Pseudomonas sp. FW305-3-2-15-E-TSA4]POA43615.1 aldo/keto reductase [Pseudomonas sp. FW305-3-2-15-E-TSA2]SNY33947.1 2,5-diketo-D-gluconate reductase B [Pseudomonas sp. LAMO17WK12:I5]SNY34314.1 2,5-diketo-D-gluconate reductase B [Pseudomonas sp. LAMO17WK12:I6]